MSAYVDMLVTMCMTRRSWLRLSARAAAVAVAVASSSPMSVSLAQPVSGPTDNASVQIAIDATSLHQKMEGFGVTTSPLVINGRDDLSPDQRARAIDAVYNQVKINMGTTPGLSEPSRNVFDDSYMLLTKQKVVDLAQPYGYNGYFLDASINAKWGSPWLARLRTTDYNAYIDAAANQVLRSLLYWRDKLGTVPRYTMLFNEPLGGSNLLPAGTPRDLVDIVKRAGRALRGAGFGSVKFVIPSEETEEQSLSEARVVLADAEAAQYVGVLSYHPYPYESIYASAPNILRTSGAGAPDPGRVAVRNQFRDLAAQFNLAVWMTEVSHSEVDALSYQGFRARAIHIHDELLYADAAAYFGMGNMWDSVAHQEHFGNKNILTEDSTIALIDTDTDRLYISGMGRAIGHYARWIGAGVVRIQSDTSDPLVQVTAFRDDGNSRVVLVLNNNTDLDRSVSVSLNGLRITGSIIGEQSTPTAYWQPLDASGPSDAANFSTRLPPLSVTTLAAAFS